MLELAILGLLKERPMHGYDLRKRMRSGFGLLASLSFGSLYPALARLERAGAVREIEPRGRAITSMAGSALGVGSTAEVIPLTGSLSGERAAFRARLAARAASSAKATARSAAGSTRGRKIYELTEVGDSMFASLLADETDYQSGDKSFALRWSFARYLTSEGRLRLLERQRRRIEERVASAERGLSNPHGTLDRYERQVAEHTIDSLNQDLSWLESLIAIERSSSVAASSANTETDVS